MHFPFEKLIAYQRSLKFVAEVNRLLRGKQKLFAPGVADQFARAALSIPLNIAEGSGRWHAKDKRHFFCIARGSTYECAALAQVLSEARTLTYEEYLDFKVALIELAKLLSGLIRKSELTRQPERSDEKL